MRIKLKYYPIQRELRIEESAWAAKLHHPTCLRNTAIRDTICEIHVHPTIDPSAALRACPELVEGTPVRAGPNGADRVLGDKERRLTEIFPECDGIRPLFLIAGRRIDKNRRQNGEGGNQEIGVLG